ncbi:MAG TPA: hypothetical protein VM865_04365, partial [Acidobacteriaceae bacterium]|nr:hypothetical protein [Acidobacteriaceae bacterium]
FAAGETVPVQYRAADGRDAEIATTGRVYRMAVVLGALGTALFDLGAVFWAFRRYRETYGRTQRAQPRRGGWGRRG